MHDKYIQVMPNKISAIQILGEEILTELNNYDSSLIELLDNYAFIFVLGELEPKIRYEFLKVLDEADDPLDAIHFARKSINDFDARLESNIKLRIQTIITTTVTKT